MRNCDLLILPINGAFGNLNEKEACDAISIINPKLTVPCHFLNFKEHGGNPNIFSENLSEICPNVSVTIMQMGEFIPNGESQNIENTIFDFTNFKKIGTNIIDDQLKNRNGYDHCYMLEVNEIKEVAIVKSEKSGIVLTVSTNKPAMQLYTANDLNSTDM